jgi:outer membrane biosynthesis protein TonB
MRAWAALAACFVTACAGSSEHRAEQPAPRAAPVVSSGPSEPPAPPAAEPPSDAGAKPIPPLSSPNAKPQPTAATDAQAAPPEEGIPHVDPRQTALRRAGEAAQSCYASAGLPAGTSGKLHVRITLAADGKVARAEVDRAKSSAKLIGGKLEQCVLAAIRLETFAPPRSGTEVQLEVPIDLRPP